MGLPLKPSTPGNPLLVALLHISLDSTAHRWQHSHMVQQHSKRPLPACSTVAKLSLSCSLQHRNNSKVHSLPFCELFLNSALFSCTLKPLAACSQSPAHPRVSCNPCAICLCVRLGYSWPKWQPMGFLMSPNCWGEQSPLTVATGNQCPLIHFLCLCSWSHSGREKQSVWPGRNALKSSLKGHMLHIHSAASPRNYEAILSVCGIGTCFPWF